MIKIEPHEKDNCINFFTEHLMTMYPNRIYQNIKAQLIRTCNVYEDIINKGANDIEIAQAHLFFTDQLLNEYKKQDKKTFSLVQCREGCSSCCNICVAASKYEVALILSYINDNKIKIDTNKLKKQSHYSTETWHRMNKHDQKCIFLKHGKCSIYKVRPAACRMHFSMDQNVCKNGEWKDAIKLWRPIQISMIGIATTISGSSDFMPNALLKAMEVKEK